MQIKSFFWMSLLLCGFTLTPAQDIIQPTDNGSKVHFVIRNFGFNTGGDFTGLKGTIRFDPRIPAAASFNVTVDASTIDTDNSTRDRHLRKDDYFYVEKYPEIRMESTRVFATTKQGRFQFNGNLTIKGISKPIQFQYEVAAKDGGYVFVSDDFSINRRDFNVGSSSITLADNLVVSLRIFAK